MNFQNEDNEILNLISSLHILKPNRHNKDARLRVQDEIDAVIQGNSRHRYHLDE